MAIAMEVGWPASELGSSSDSYPALIGKKRGWGDDQQKLLQLMMGPSKEDTRITLDLLGGSSSVTHHSQFLDLNPDAPLPSGWEKRLDLKSGSIYFVNWNTGITTTSDPRKSQQSSLKTSPCSSTEDGKLWMEQLQLGNGTQTPVDAENVELNLNLSIKNESSLSVCTVEKVQLALARSEIHRNMQQFPSSPAFASDIQPESSSDHLSWTLQPAAAASPATSTSSSSSLGIYPKPQFKSRISHNLKPSTPRITNSSSSTAPGSDKQNETVILTGCKRCLTYVMLSASDPICPRCGTTVLISNLSFSPTKRSKVELTL